MEKISRTDRVRNEEAESRRSAVSYVQYAEERLT